MALTEVAHEDCRGLGLPSPLPYASALLSLETRTSCMPRSTANGGA